MTTMGSTTMRKQAMTIKLCSLVVLALGISACSSISLKEDETARPIVQQTQDTTEENIELTPFVEPEPVATLQTTSGSTADELQALIKDRAVRELRTAYNGSYGVSLLFNPTTL